MKRTLSIFFAVVAWFAVITQYCLMIENRVAPVGETTIRFFSFFTILTNSIAAIYFTLRSYKSQNDLSAWAGKPGTLTAIASYISIVGLVYQIILRPLWSPAGLQKLVDELLHSVIPIMVIVYWYLYENKTQVMYNRVPAWLIYPLLYLIFILIRGSISGFYPYPFVDAGRLGFLKVTVNSILLMLFFAAVSMLFIRIGKAIKNKG